jgi:hypothetical protein
MHHKTLYRRCGNSEVAVVAVVGHQAEPKLLKFSNGHCHCCVILRILRILEILRILRIASVDWQRAN